MIWPKLPYNSTLNEEIDLFMDNLDRWLDQYPGKFVAIKGTKVLIEDTEEEAKKKAHEAFGRGWDYLVREISTEYKVHGRNGKPYSTLLTGEPSPQTQTDRSRRNITALVE